MTDSESLGISVDIGTSNLTLHLINAKSSHVILERIVSNPQAVYGDEIISRMDAAREPEKATNLAALVREKIGNEITSMLVESMSSSDSVQSVVIVGNTTMHHLYFKLPTHSLMRPPYLAEEKDPIQIPAPDVGLPFSSITRCYSPPIIESYVGADAVAMMIATGFPDSEKNMISIDVGTNTEIAILTEGKMWVTSAASGPAFEGMSIECGVPGAPGAISSVSIKDSAYSPEYEVIGGGKPSGICGTGVVSAIASMLDKEIILPRGSFNRNLSSPWLVLDSNIVHYIIAPGSESTTGSDVVMTQPDVRMLQQSKAAIRGAFDLLLDHSDLVPDDIVQLNLTGIFGSYLSFDDTVRIGLFPALPSAEVRQLQGGAIRGADLLHRVEYQQVANRIASKVRHVNLTDNPAFKKNFAESLKFPSK
ncbi:MAG: ASKHA domain-containing protein [Candidatus Thorarchaeota archaeon]